MKINLGQKFGQWTALKELGYRWKDGYRLDLSNNNGIYYECRCDCGKVKAVKKPYLVHGLSRSCQSCAAKNVDSASRVARKTGIPNRGSLYHSKNVAGSVFGSWTVLRWLGRRIEESFNPQDPTLVGGYCECRCMCGVVRPVRLASLKLGKSKSCGKANCRADGQLLNQPDVEKVKRSA